MSRIDWDKYFINLAYQVSTRATCPRRHVGAVIVKNRIQVAAGYNGAPSDIDDCYKVGCDIVTNYEMENGELKEKNHCVRTVHAEQNAIIFSSHEDRKGATIYVTDQPCWTCANIVANSGIKEVVYHRPYLKQYEKVGQLFNEKGITFRKIENYEIPAFIEKKEVTE